MEKSEDIQKERITYENAYDKHIADLKIKIIYKFLIDATVLDVGCGETETVYRRVGRIMQKYVGIDKDLKEPLKGENFEYHISTLEDFQTEKKFDVVLLFGTIEEALDENTHLKLARSFLKKRGNLFISIPNPWSLNRIMGACNGFIENPQTPDIHDIRQGHRRLLTIEQLVETCEKNGLQVSDYWPVGFKPVPMSDMPMLKKYWHQFDNMMFQGKKYQIDMFCAGWLLQATPK
ncbi:MAG: methyltransferase domain-containing protein [Candidatus Lokiarchaeota archaeon]|nr:methyltransferase domain-containing protein [Candidatus Lokiarchaeota archaeon]